MTAPDAGFLASPTEPSGATDSITVLHVDDHADFLEMTERFLGGELDDFVVETATSASAGLDRLTGGTSTAS